MQQNQPSQTISQFGPGKSFKKSEKKRQSNQNAMLIGDANVECSHWFTVLFLFLVKMVPWERTRVGRRGFSGETKTSVVVTKSVIKCT